MKKRMYLFIFVLTALVFVISGCDINNPVIDEWWVGEPVDQGRGDLPFTQETFVVSFDLGGGKYVDSINGNSPDVSPQRVWAHAHASVPGLVANGDNNFFTGWYIDGDDDGIIEPTDGNKWDFANDTVDKDMTLYAQWAPSGHKVDFDINFPEDGFNEDANLTYKPLQELIADGALAAEPLQFGLKPDSPYVDTHVFTGWYIDGDNSGTLDTGETTKWNFATMTVTADKADANGIITLYARWAEIVNPNPPEPLIEVYTVIFDSDADINPPPNQYVISGEPVIAPYVTYKDGYFFGGWYKDDDCTDDWVFSGAEPDKADSANDAKDGATDKIITLYAKWTPVDDPVTPEYFVVSFDSGGGNYVDSINGNNLSVSPQRVWAHAHAHASVPGLVEKTGNYFTGWYNAQTGGAKWDFANDTVEADMTLFAQWAPSGRTVDFKINFDPEASDFHPETDLTYTPSREYIAYGAYAAEPLQFGLISNSSYVDIYVFTGWYDASIGGNKWDFANDTVTKNETLYARWAKTVNPEPPEVYTVKFDSNADTNPPPPPPNQYVISGEPVIAPYVTYRSGYFFGGWYKNTECTDDWVFDTDKADSANDGLYGATDKVITLYAKWEPVDPETFVVSFDSGGGKYVDSIDGGGPGVSVQRVFAHAHASVPGLVTKENNYFTGWYIDDDGDGNIEPTEVTKWDFATDTVEKDMTLFAQWVGSGEPGYPGHTVDFNINFPEDGFNEDANLTYKPLRELIADGALAAEPLQFGLKSDSSYVDIYVFTGWYDAQTDGDKWDFANDTVTKNETLYARWAKIVNPETPLEVYTVIFDSNAETNSPPPPPNQYVISGEPVIAPYVTYRSGYFFGGWYKNAECTEAWVFDTDKADSANDGLYGATDKVITLYAKWEPVDPETFVVSFDSGGGNYVDSIDGGGPSASPQRVFAHAHASVPGLVTKENNYFTGWYDAQTDGAKWDFATDTVDKDMTLYAQWAPSGRTVDFNINFDPEASDFHPDTDLTYEPQREYIAYGAYAAEPLQFGLRSNSSYVNTYVFTGWYDASIGGNKWDFANDTVTKNETLYARWAKTVNPEPPEVYKVIFNSEDNTNPPPDQYVMSGESVIAPYVRYRDGYSFGGWYKNAECTDDWVFDTDKADSANDGLYGATDKTITLYAKWEPVAPAAQETFVVSFDSGGGKYVDSITGNSPSASPQRVFAHTHASVPGLVTKENNYFTGWYDAQTGGAKWDFANNTVEADMTLFAQWAPSGHKVDFVINFPEDGFNEDANLTYKPLQELIADGAYAVEPLQFGLKSDSSYVNTYVFTGWYDASDGDNKWDFANDTVTKNEILYARWAEIVKPEPLIEVYTIIFDSKADINPPPNQHVMSGEPVIAPYVTYRDGYAFGGWYKDVACTDDWVFSGAVPDDTDKADSANDGLYGATDKIITLHAKWAPVDPVDIFKDLRILYFNYVLFAGGSTTYNQISYGNNASTLTPSEVKANDAVIASVRHLLQTNPTFRVMVIGHANPTTPEDHANPLNPSLMEISNGRVDAVKTKLDNIPNYDTTITPILTNSEGGKQALQDPTLSRRGEIVVFDIITEVTQ